jgi:CxxC motif-containing protein (DUF1111 family)
MKKAAVFAITVFWSAAAAAENLPQPLPGLTQGELNFFDAALARFQEVDSVTGSINDAPPGIQSGNGLGPRFNGNSCSSCHAQPVIGGSSAAVNPQIAVASLDGAKNTIPPFISLNGPVREARFIRNPDGTPDGGVHDLFVITGRSDAPGCNIVQPDFVQALQQNNVIFRIPTPLFGLGLVEATPDLNLETAAAAQQNRAATLGIATGVFNTSGNDGTITRFGWKAQNKSLLMFSGEAYNVEIGVTNELFPNERDDTPSCQFNQLPEDSTNLTDSPQLSNSPASDYSSDIVNFAAFMRMAAPLPEPPFGSNPGQAVFDQVGCNICHIETQTTGSSSLLAQSNYQYHPFSDFALHDMGNGLADGVTQGQANGNQFRTAPLWGVGQRLFLLHDGRTSDLRTAILAHQSNGSEANLVIQAFQKLPVFMQQALLDFLGSL